MNRNNQIGIELLKEEVTKRYEKYFDAIRDWYLWHEEDETIDIDACLHQEMINNERDIEQIKHTYINRGLNEDLVEKIVSDIEKEW